MEGGQNMFEVEGEFILPKRFSVTFGAVKSDNIKGLEAGSSPGRRRCHGAGLQPALTSFGKG